MSNIKRVVEIVGSQTKTASNFGIRQSHVWKWINVHGQAPAKYIRKLSALTNNEITVEQLLADHEQNSQKEIE